MKSNGLTKEENKQFLKRWEKIQQRVNKEVDETFQRIRDRVVHRVNGLSKEERDKLIAEYERNYSLNKPNK